MLKKKFIPALYLLEMDLTHRCTLHCYNCNRCTSVALSNKYQDVSLEQIEKFISQSIKNNYQWKRIRLLGGEPTIHPDFEEIVRLLFAYKTKHNPNMQIQLVSNGHTEHTKEKLAWVRANYPELLFKDTVKQDGYQIGFYCMNIAPLDKSDDFEKHEYNGCWVVEYCGIGLNYSGFYCCAVAGAVARVFGYEIGIKDVDDLNQENLQRMYNQVCSKCGYYDPVTAENEKAGTIISPTWEKALNIYKQRNQELVRF